MLSFSIVFWIFGFVFVGTWIYLAIRDYKAREEERKRKERLDMTQNLGY